jgi:hypothetical protein
MKRLGQALLNLAMLAVWLAAVYCSFRWRL